MASDSWLIDGMNTGTRISQTLSWDGLSITTQHTQSVNTDIFDTVRQNAEKGTRIVDSQGFPHVYDTTNSGSANTYTFTPPDEETNLFSEKDYVVVGYTRTTTASRGQHYQSTIDAVPVNQYMESAASPSESLGSNEFHFKFYSNDFVTQRVRQTVDESTTDAVESISITVNVSASEANIIRGSLAYLGAVNVRAVPDGANVADDNSPGNRNTVDIDSPDEDIITSGTYVAENWEIEYLNTDAYAVTLDLLKQA